MESCKECGMQVERLEYHPYAACLMFKACKNSKTVRANLNGVRNDVIDYCALVVDYSDPALAEKILELKEL